MIRWTGTKWTNELATSSAIAIQRRVPLVFHTTFHPPHPAPPTRHPAMRLAAFSTLSFAAAGAVILRALSLRAFQFFPAMVHVSKSGGSVLVLLSAAFAIGIALGKAAVWAIFGGLRAVEVEVRLGVSFREGAGEMDQRVLKINSVVPLFSVSTSMRDHGSQLQKHAWQ